MSFLCETPDPTVQPTTTTTIQQLPAYENEARQSLYSRAQGAANEPYQPYGAPRVADFNADQQSAFQGARNIQGQWNPALQQAYGATTGGATTFPQANLSAYMNPYQQQVTDIAAREASRNSAIRQNSIADQFIKGNSFGGSRSGIAQAEENRNLGQQLDDIQMKGGQQAFQQAGQLFNADADRLLKAGSQYGTLATQQQGLGLRDLAAQQAVGEAQQGLTQKNYDTAYGNFLEQRNYPQQQSNFLANVIKGTSLPTGSTTTGQQLIPQASPISQAAGLGTTALGLYGLSKAFFAQGGRVGMAEGGPVWGGSKMTPTWGGNTMSPEDLKRIVTNPAVSEEIRGQALQDLLMRGTGSTSETFGRLANGATGESEFSRNYYSSINRPSAPGTADGFEASPRAAVPEVVPPPTPKIPLEEEQGPPPVVPGATRAAGQSRGMGASPQPQGSFYETAMAKINAADKPYEPTTKPLDINAPELKPLDEKVSPWMAITRAGLGMMSAKPGQSALQAIGEGGTKGFEQLSEDMKIASSNKKANYENNLKQADFYLKKASTENNRLHQEKQLMMAEKQLKLAQGKLDLDLAAGMALESYHKGSLAIQSRYADKAGGGGQLTATKAAAQEIAEKLYPNDPRAQAEYVGNSLFGNRQAAMLNAENRRSVDNIEEDKIIESLKKRDALFGVRSPEEQNRMIAAERQRRLGGGPPVNKELQSLFGSKP